VTEGVQRAQADRLELLRTEDPAPADRGGRGQRRRTRTGVVRLDLEGAAVSVMGPADGAVLLLVGGLRDSGGRGRARDVGDRGDVVPVDAVPEPQDESGHEDAEPGGDR
jgi:hypothetical protein